MLNYELLDTLRFLFEIVYFISHDIFGVFEKVTTL